MSHDLAMLECVVNVSEGATLTALSNPGGAGTGGGTGGIRLAHTTTGRGTLNLNGGIVQATGIAESNATGQSYLYLNGTTLDFVTQGLTGGFTFVNPNAKSSCGCGTSFTA